MQFASISEVCFTAT